MEGGTEVATLTLDISWAGCPGPGSRKGQGTVTWGSPWRSPGRRTDQQTDQALTKAAQIMRRKGFLEEILKG